MIDWSFMARDQLAFTSHEKQKNMSDSAAASSQFTTQSTDPDGSGDDNGAIAGRRNGRPPQLLLTLLGDYWWRSGEQLPSTALVALLAEFGMSDVAARAALSRLTHHGLLVTSKRGRQTFYGLSERGIRVLDEGARHIFSFGLHSCPWDHMWSLVAFSIPEQNRKLRHVLRDRLRWLGFAPLYDGLWISPRDSLSETASQLAELSIHTATLFRAHIVDGIPDDGLPQHVWDLDALRIQYESFITDVEQLRTRMEHGSLSPEEALITRTRLLNSWLGFPTFDPDLPDELLPPDWPRERARQLFVTMYDELGPLAQHRVQHIIARYAPNLAEAAVYHSSDAFLPPDSAS